jgi:hypothetical protein
MGWETDLPVNELPDDLQQMYVVYAKFLLGDILSRTPPVMLLPAPEPKFSGHKVRYSQNPDWYRRLYNTTSHWKRQRALAALVRISNLQDREFRIKPFKYDATLRDFITDCLLDGLKEYGIPPSNRARQFFDISPLEEALERCGEGSPGECTTTDDTEYAAHLHHAYEGAADEVQF